MNLNPAIRIGLALTTLGSALLLTQAATQNAPRSSYKQQTIDLMKSLETGDPSLLAVISARKYLQHNLSN